MQTITVKKKEISINNFLVEDEVAPEAIQIIINDADTISDVENLVFYLHYRNKLGQYGIEFLDKNYENGTLTLDWCPSKEFTSVNGKTEIQIFGYTSAIEETQDEKFETDTTYYYKSGNNYIAISVYPETSTNSPKVGDDISDYETQYQLTVYESFVNHRWSTVKASINIPENIEGSQIELIDGSYVESILEELRVYIDAGRLYAEQAITSATNASTSKTMAEKWAENPVDTPVEQGKYSAKHHATKASESATIADNARITDISEQLSYEDAGVNTITITYKDGSVKTFSVRNGSKGSQGEQGIQGIQGVQGIQGIQGQKGDTGDPFEIYNTYSSIAEMNADLANVPKGKFVLISSNVEDPDNSKLFIRNTSAFGFVTDLSGAQGIKGEKGEQGIQGIQGIQGETGQQGIQGVQGIQGIQGPAGPGVPIGGLEGYLLKKRSATNFDTEWVEDDAYRKPSTGIPKTDFSSEVINSLNNAEDAKNTDDAIGDFLTELRTLLSQVAYTTSSPNYTATINALDDVLESLLPHYSVIKSLSNCTLSNVSTRVLAQGAYSSDVTADSGYDISTVTVLMGGVDITSSAWSSATGKITIASVTGDISITASAVPVATIYTITKSLSNCTIDNQASSIVENQPYTATVTADTDYTLSTAVITMGGVDITSTAWSLGTGAISIASVTGNVSITVTAVSAYTVETLYENYTSTGTRFYTKDVSIDFNNGDYIEAIVDFSNAQGVLDDKSKAYGILGISKNFSGSSTEYLEISNGENVLFFRRLRTASTSGENFTLRIVDKANSVDTSRWVRIDDVSNIVLTFTGTGFKVNGVFLDNVRNNVTHLTNESAVAVGACANILTTGILYKSVRVYRRGSQV